MPRPTADDPNHPLKKAKHQFNEYVRASDAVEVMDPEGATEIVPGKNQSIRITEYGCKIIEFYAANALPHEIIAKRLGIDGRTLTRRIMAQPEVAEAFARGKADNQYELTECLMGMARRGNVVAAIYLTKVLHKWRDNDPVQQTTQNNVVIQIPASMSMEELKKLAEAGVSPMQLPEVISTAPELPVIDAESD